MKKFFALMAVVLAVVSCQKDVDNLDVNMGGDVATISVTLPADAITRAAADETDSAWSGLQNVKDETLRVIFQVYDENGETNEGLRQTTTLRNGELTANFNVRLVPNRQYTFVAWADQGEEYFNVADLKDVKLLSWEAMDECRDAFTATHTESNFTSSSNITLELIRPFAKLRVVTTDMVELGRLKITPDEAKVEYAVALPNAFNAYAGEVGTTTTTKTFDKFEIAEYNKDAANTMTLFTDYILVPTDKVVKFSLKTMQDGGREIKTNNFVTDIPVKRNNLTTIQGNILTDGTNVNVTVDEEFENQNNTTGAPYYQEAVTNAVDLIKALKASKEIIVLNDITVTAVDVALATTRAEVAIYPVINLNGFTITIENTNNEALVNLNGGTLTVEGEGAIVSTDGALVEGTTVVTEGATVEADVAVDENGDSAIKTGVEALQYVIANGGKFTMTDNLTTKDLTFSEILAITAKNPVIIDGNGKTLTSSATRAINVSGANDVTIKNLNIVASGERAINVIQNSKMVTIENVTATAANYTFNVAGTSAGAVAIIKNSDLTGMNTVNIAAENTNVTITNTKLTTVDNTEVEDYATIAVNKYAEGSKVAVNGGEVVITGTHCDGCKVASVGSDNSEVTFDGTVGATNDDVVIIYFATIYSDGTYYGHATLDEAIAQSEEDNGSVITLIRNYTTSEAMIIENGKTITLNLNGKTITGYDESNGSFGLITNKGNLTVTGNGKITLAAAYNREWSAYSSVISNTVGGNLTVNEGVTIEHLGGTDMAYGIDNLTNGKGTSAIVTINGATVKSTYRPIRQFLNGTEAANELYVKANSTIYSTRGNKAIWMQDPSKNANTGKLVVEAGAQVHSVYLDVTPGSTEWPVEVSVVASSLTDDSENHGIYTDGIPAGYEVVEKDGIWTVICTKVYTVDELVAALKACKPIILGADITVTEKWDNRYNGAKVTSPITIDGNGKTLKFACEVKDNNYLAAFRFEAPAVVKNLTFDLSEVKNKCAAISTKGNIIVDNCTFIGSTSYTGCRGIRFGEGAGNAISNVEVAVTNSTFTNLGRGITDNENGDDAKSVTITNNTCTNAHVYVSAHDSIVFTGNTMVNSAANFKSYTSAQDATVVATDNTLDMAQYNVINGFAAANIDCQEGFTIK